MNKEQIPTNVRNQYGEKGVAAYQRGLDGKTKMKRENMALSERVTDLENDMAGVKAEIA